MTNTRTFSHLAAELCYGKKGVENLKAGKCVSCGGDCDTFRDTLSRKEFAISGMCQECQDKVFSGD